MAEAATKTTKKRPSQYGQTFGRESFPAEMRRQLWPLCCGASIISGFKSVNVLTDEELVADIEAAVKAIPDFQVYGGEQINPKLTFLTLNSGQMGSQKIMDAIKKAGFVKFGEGKPRGSTQGFFVRDDSKTFSTETLKNGEKAA